MTSLIQLHHHELGRRVALVQDNALALLRTYRSIYAMAQNAIDSGRRLAEVARADQGEEVLDYDPIYRGESDWRLLPAFDHPEEPARCLVTGTGLTHKASAESRQAMHETEQDEELVLTDSMQMYQWGLEGGRPAPGTIGTPPEWFYKGCGTILRAHGEPLVVPSYAEDGGDEAEVAGVYVIDPQGQSRRVGLVVGNEFSDHVTEEKNYLYLAPSKLRLCSIGPELVVEADFQDVRGTTRIERQGQVIWSGEAFTGEANMCHTVANMEHHHFKYAAHRRPGDVHIHFFGADLFSFSAGMKLIDGDVMVIEFPGFGRPLRNPLQVEGDPDPFIAVKPL